jgi:ATP-dependent helicase/nuclease subunit A
LNRAVRAGDILILVRKRAPFAAPMVKALKNLGIPVAGADRMQLTEQLAVMDLMALGDCLLLPEDDLTLAALLKSPAFGFDDDDLFHVGHGRSGSLWDALAAKADGNLACARAVRQLRQWRAAAAREKPFEFYMARLESDGLRRALLARLGPEAGDAIDEFLSLALDYEASQTPSLQGFLHWLRVSGPEVKRDMEQERDEVRVMTVHGSKGLEANIVFLADTCSARSASRGGLVGLAAPASLRGVDTVPAWLLPGSQLVPQIRDACEAVQQRDREEYQRLLYVAMTRARDRLYVAGFEGTRGRDKGCWYDLISEGLETRLTEATDGLGGPVRRMDCPQTAPVPEGVAELVQLLSPAVPDWLARRVIEVPRQLLLNPSRLELPQHGVPAQGTTARPRDEALLRGRAVHRLLELLPSVPPRDRQSAGARFLAAEARRMPQRQRESLLAAVLAILGDASFGEVFGPRSQAEVALAAELPPRVPGEPPAIISGQVDRLVCSGSATFVVDFKSGAAVPASAEAAPMGYIAQLAAYRLALARLFPGKPVRAALLWTEAPRLMVIPNTLLDQGETLLYESLRSRHLDLPPPTHQL